MEQIDCPALLPEGPETPLLTKMLFPAPYEVPEKKAQGTRDGLRRKGASDTASEDTEDRSSITEDGVEDEEEEEKVRPPCRREKKEGGLHSFGGQGVQEGENLSFRQSQDSYR